MIRKAVGLMLIGGCLAVSASAWAHHSNAAYDSSKITTITGTVSAVKWTNPHMQLEVAVPTGDGGTEIWEIEMSSTGGSASAGITPGNLKPGAKVKVYGHRHHEPSTRRANLRVLEIDGKPYGRNGDIAALVPEQ